MISINIKIFYFSKIITKKKEKKRYNQGLLVTKI